MSKQGLTQVLMSRLQYVFEAVVAAPVVAVAAAGVLKVLQAMWW
jgi:hypothetical protein